MVEQSTFLGAEPLNHFEDVQDTQTCCEHAINFYPQLPIVPLTVMNDGHQVPVLASLLKTQIAQSFKAFGPGACLTNSEEPLLVPTNLTRYLIDSNLLTLGGI